MELSKGVTNNRGGSPTPGLLREFPAVVGIEGVGRHQRGREEPGVMVQSPQWPCSPHQMRVDGCEWMRVRDGNMVVEAQDTAVGDCGQLGTMSLPLSENESLVSLL